MAVLSALLVVGSFSLSIAELGFPLAIADSGDSPHTVTPAPFTYAPGQPTFTPPGVSSDQLIGAENPLISGKCNYYQLKITKRK